MLKSLFYKGAGLKACIFIKKRLQNRCFLENIVKLLRTPILKNICERLLLMLLWKIHFREIIWKFVTEIIFYLNIISVTNFQVLSLKYMTWGFCFLRASEFIHYIADTIREKVVAIIASKQFMTLLSNGKKTQQWKGTSACSSWEWYPCIFCSCTVRNGRVRWCRCHLSKKGSWLGLWKHVLLLDYLTKLMSATSDGANVNLGICHGTLKMIK